MANKPTQPVFPLGLAAEEQSTLAGVLNTGTIEHGPDAVLTLPEGNASAGLPSSVRYNADSDEFEGFYENGGWLPLGGGGIRWEVLPHASTATLTEGRGYLINNTTGASTVVLPSPTRIGDSVTICDAYGKFATYPLTVSPSGNNLYGSTEDMAITTDNVSATFTWSGPEQGWIITSGVGLGQGRVYSREIFTKILASETSSVALNTPPTIVDVYADGKRLAESKYSLDGNVITFSPSLPANTELQVIEYTPIQLGNGGGSSSSTITWVYNGGSAIGGETEITLDVVVDDVPAIDINGSRQYKNLGFTFDPLTSKITLAQELEPEDEVVVIINGTPNIYNQIDYTLREVARVTNVKDTEVVYFSVGAALSGYKVIYDKETQRAYPLPADIAPGTTAVSLSPSAVLVHSAGSVDLGELAVSREEYVTLSGTFDSGATLNVKNELLTHTTGKYRWDGELPKTVSSGSTLESAGGTGLGKWVSVGDASLRANLIDANDHLGDALVAVKQPYTGSFARTQHSKNMDTISVKDFGATGDGITDDTAAIQYAFDAAHYFGRKLYFPAGVYQVSSTLTAKLGTHYSKYGLSIEGEGRGASVIQFTFTDTDSPVAGINLVPESGSSGYNFDIKGMTLKGTTAAAVSSLIYCTTETSGIILNHLYMHQAITAFHTPHNCWISEFHNLNMSCRDYGIRMDGSGTTNRFDGCFVYGAAVSAYKLRGGYSTIGALAADECTGTIYDLRFFEGSAQCLGSEQPSIGVVPDCIVNCDNGIVNIDYLLGLNSAPVDGTTWYAVKVGSGTVDIKNLLVSSNTGSDSSVAVTGGLINGYSGTVTVQNIVAVHNLWSAAPVPLTFSTPILRNSPLKIKSPTSTEVAVHQGGKPYIGFGAANAKRPIDLDGVLSKRNLQTIYMDSSGDPRNSGVGVNLQTGLDRWQLAPAQGSWFMENDPLSTGRSGYACSVSGIDINSSSFLGIPVITTTKPTANLIVGQSFFSVEHNKPLWWNGSNWVDAIGTIVA